MGCGPVRGGGFLEGFVAGGLEGVPGEAPGLRDEGGEEVDHDDAAGGGDGAELVVGEVAWGVGEGAGGAVRGDDGGGGCGQNVFEALV